MTVKEFFESDKGLVIHCDTKKKALKLLKAFDRLGYKWNDGDSYFKYNFWDVYEKDTCYSNVWGYGPIYYYQEKCCTILKFEDIEFEGETIRERINKLSNDDFIEWILNTISIYEKNKKADKYTITYPTIYEDIDERKRFKKFMLEVLEKKQEIEK